MKLKIVKFTNEGAIVELKGESYTLPRGRFKNLNVGDEVDAEVDDKKKKTVYLVDNLPKEGELRVFIAKERSKVGWFMETKTPHDLFIPFIESFSNVRERDKVLVKVLRDREGRLFGTMKIKNYLTGDHSYKENDNVEGTVYSINKDMGVFVAVDEKHDARIEPKELTRAYEIGDKITARVKLVYEDGKMSLSLRQRAHLQMNDDSVIIMEKLSRNPKLMLGDKSNPEEIFEELKMSKQAFKRAAGRLKKQGLVEIGPNYIRRVEE